MNSRGILPALSLAARSKDDPQTDAVTEMGDQTLAELEQRIDDLEAEVERLRQMIQNILDILHEMTAQ